MFDETLKLAKQGDDRAIERLLVPYLPALTAFVRLRLLPRVAKRESPADIVQSVCREVISDLSSIRAVDEEGFRSWLFSVTFNKVRNKHAFHHASKRNVVQDLSGSFDFGVGEEVLLSSYGRAVTPSQDAAASEEIARIEAAFALLPVDYRDVLLHVGIAGLSYAEAGRLLEKTENAIRQLVHRARARLATLLD